MIRIRKELERKNSSRERKCETQGTNLNSESEAKHSKVVASHNDTQGQLGSPNGESNSSHQVTTIQMVSLSIESKKKTSNNFSVPIDSKIFISYPSLDPSKSIYETSLTHVAMNRPFFAACTFLDMVILYALIVSAF